jgi:hypothetical protein
MMHKSGEQRLLMGCSMYDAARKIVQSDILARRPAITPGEMKKEIFLRFYGQEFSHADNEKLFSALTSGVSHSDPRRA